MIATPHRPTLTALAALSLLATPFALAQQAAVTSVTSVTPAKDATAITRQDNLAVTNWDVGDGTKYGIELRNSVLIYTEGVTLATRRYAQHEQGRFRQGVDGRPATAI